MLLFLDANILFSASISEGGRARQLFEFARLDACRLASSRFAVEEARRNLAAKNPSALANFVSLSAAVSITPEASERLIFQLTDILPLKDAPILAAAIAGEAYALVTGDDRHFSQLFGKRIEGVLVMRLSEVVRQLSLPDQ